MCGIYYRFRIGNKALALDLEIEQMIRIMEKYGRFHSSLESVPNEKIVGVKREKDEKVIYDIFYENMHIHSSIAEVEKIYSIRIKKDEDEWTFGKNEDGQTDYSHPTNKYYEIYVWYDVPVLDITSSCGHIYKHGNWDKYVYKTVNRFIRDTNAITDDSEFNEQYSRRHKQATKEI